ncbi:uncharacterized protein LOC143459782 isoform X2 [Clavelina lepadiformis]|uniref:uncharacterized protein LOC143459782 isoform X2 n=1 Tax=Clavelina lepadiformis TaxID=159417 RepID=UPI0040411149
MGNTATFPNKELIKARDILPSVEKNLSQLRVYHNELTTNKSLNKRVQNLLDELDILAQINNEADKLADLDGASLLFKFMKALKGSLKNKSVFKCYETIRGVFWNATDHSKGFCDKCKECGLMEYLLDDLRTYKSIFKNDLENHGYLVFQAISILQNCARSSQVCLLHLRQLNVANLLYWYRENSSKLPIRSWTCLDLLSAVLLSHAVVEKEQKDDIFVVSDQLLYDVTELIQSLQDARHRCEGFSTEELLVDLSLFSNNDKNNYVLARASDFITSLAEVLKSGKDKEILAALKLVTKLISNKENIKIVKSSEKILESVRRIQTKSGNQKHKVIATQIVSAIDAHSDESNSNKDKDGDIDETIQLGPHFRNFAQVLSSTDFSTSVNSSSSTSSSGQRETDSVKQFVKDQLDTMKDGRNRLQRFSVINEAATQSLAKLNLSLTNPAKNKEYHLAVANEIANLGGVAVCQSFMEMMRNYEENQISDQDNRSTGEFLDNIGNLCWNASNISFQFCDECGRCGLLKHLVEILQQLENTFNQDLNGQGFRVLQAVSILHNCARLGVSDKYFGQLHMSNLIKRYAKKSRNVQIREHTSLRVVCTLLTAYTMDEKTDNVIIAEPSVIQYIIQNLHIAMSTSDHKYDGFSAEELVDGLDKLAQVDQNSLEIVKEEMVLGSLQEMLQEGDEEEKMAAVKLKTNKNSSQMTKL